MLSSLTYAERPTGVYLVSYGRKPPRFVHADASLENAGCKAFGLLEVPQSGLPIPPAFVFDMGYSRSDVTRQLTTERKVWASGLQQIELTSDRRFGDMCAPLLLAVRSGAIVFMPGVLETLLNIGLCDATLSGLLRQTGSPRLVWDTYQRPVASYSEVVGGTVPQVFEAEYSMVVGTADEVEQLSFAQLRELTRRSLRAYAQAAGRPFPRDPEAQLAGAIQAVLASWDTQKTHVYRHQYQVGENIGTAAIVQGIVFGNGSENLDADIGFTHDPATDEPTIWVDLLFDAQGEDAASGR